MKSITLSSLKGDTTSTDIAPLLPKLHHFSLIRYADVTTPVQREPLGSCGVDVFLTQMCLFHVCGKASGNSMTDNWTLQKTSRLAWQQVVSCMPATRWWGDILSRSTWIKGGHTDKEKCRSDSQGSSAALQKDDLARYSCLSQELCASMPGLEET